MHVQVHKPNASRAQQGIVQQIERRSTNRKHPRNQHQQQLCYTFRKRSQLIGVPATRCTGREPCSTSSLVSHRGARCRRQIRFRTEPRPWMAGAGAIRSNAN
jgi:hypothetical protein